MKNPIVDSIKKISDMPSKERNLLLCQLLVKNELKTILPHEMMQLDFIQAIRKANGEIDRVLKNWAENPDIDPRLQYQYKDR